MSKRVIISGGGTGGHIFPALSIANALKRLEPDIEILFVGAEGKMEMEKVPEAGYDIVGLPVQGLLRKITFKNIKVLINLLKSLRKAKSIIRTFKPDAVVGVGGYASGPVGIAAKKMKVPLVLQEQNSYAGITNRYLAKYAEVICVAYENMQKFFKPEKTILTGNPVRKNLLDARLSKAEAYKFYGLDPDRKTILVTGGSLGARTLNRMMKRALDEIADMNDVQVLWQCGGYYYKQLAEQLQDRLPENVKLTAFLKRMDLAYACADIVVARAGAGTISELCLLGKVSILVPSPNVAEDHQTHNAMALVDKDAAIMMKDDEAEDEFMEVVSKLVDNAAARHKLSENITKLGIKDSDELIAKEILKIING
ncbi:MAG: undecaprenyldiphospho-muramoylpentapeptide beta-N-acetylglucosaminyltransferase [Culturomica sp.]|jgi:UDP-N-acetylglucosamine--N-acetylmuramyl-(pentapeptide) pyrophosphoryl-undecaprenol N-acetylglucosamine transferase|nr:undecaprenyldiphospho-muramoylpentapeptide beta-N-acetylglucosaminyltransferase [Culturomica sp.]